nr:putative reverse transcriptase, RNA-dependent DNA polymerase [Tanacetum cinerariifolium]
MLETCGISSLAHYGGSGDGYGSLPTDFGVVVGCRLISWQYKKQTVVATSLTKAEYVAAASCCAQVLWIQNQLLDYGAKRTACNEFSCFIASAVICLATSRKFNFSKYIFDNMVRNVDSPSKFLMYPFLQVVMDNQVDDMTTHNTRYTSLALTQKVFANMKRVGKGFSSVETPLFASMRMHPNREGKIEAIDADEDITLVDVEINKEVVDMDAESQGRLNQEEVDAASKGVSAVSALELVSAAEPTIFDDKDVTMSMDQSLIKLKAEKAKLLDEQIAQKLHDEENMAGYKMEFFRGMTYDKVRPIFEREYKKVQTLFKLDKDVQEPKKKRIANETLLQESFKKLRATKVSGSESTQEIPSNDPKEISEEDIHNMLKIVPVREFKVKALQAYQVFEDMLKGFNREDLAALWNLVKEKFSSAVPSEDNEKALWVELKRLFEPDADDVL